MHEGGVHIEADEPAGAPVDVVLLEGDVQPALRQAQQGVLQRGALLVVQHAAHGNLDAGLGRALVHAFQRRAAGQAPDGVDIQAVLEDDARDIGDLPGRDRTAQQRHDVAVLALAADPRVIGLALDGREADLHTQLGRLEQQVLHDEAGLLRGRLEEDAHRQRLVDILLADV